MDIFDKKVDLAEDLKKIEKKGNELFTKFKLYSFFTIVSFFLDFCLGTNEQSKSSAKLIKYFEKKPRFRRKSQRNI